MEGIYVQWRPMTGEMTTTESADCKKIIIVIFIFILIIAAQKRGEPKQWQRKVSPVESVTCQHKSNLWCQRCCTLQLCNVGSTTVRLDIWTNQQRVTYPRNQRNEGLPASYQTHHPSPGNFRLNEAAWAVSARCNTIRFRSRFSMANRTLWTK
jgi:hypothetical protein